MKLYILGKYSLRANQKYYPKVNDPRAFCENLRENPKIRKFEKSVFCEMFVALATSVLKKFFFQTWIFLKSRSLPFRTKKT